MDPRYPIIDIQIPTANIHNAHDFTVHQAETRRRRIE